MTNYQVRVDLYPATLRLTNESGEERTLDKVRIVMTLDHVFVFQDANPKPAIVFEDRLNSYTPPTPATRVRKASDLLNRYAEFETADGTIGTFQKMSGCGCGSRLKTASLQSIMPNDEIAQAASKNDHV